jgi:uncharacterized spore protein YtfJ
MEECESLLRTSLAEIERVLNTKTVIGDPMTIDGNTIVPLVGITFGFGAGYGSGTGGKQGKGEGTGGGSGGAGRVKPVAVIVGNRDGVNVVPIVGGAATAMEKAGEAAVKIVSKAMEKRGQK